MGERWSDLTVMDNVGEPEVGPSGAVRADGAIARSKAAAVAMTDRARSSAERVRDEVPAANAGYEAFLEDFDIGGPLIAGAVAFRLFLWLLPYTLVGVVGFGLLATAGKQSTDSLARTAGIRGIAAKSIAQATSASTRGRWLVLAIGVFALISTTGALVKALWRSHELAWHVPRSKMPAKPKAVGACLGLATACLAASAGISRLREANESIAFGALVLAFVLWGGIWLVASLVLPHGDAPWTALIPGAILVAVAAELLQLVTVYYVAGKVGSSSAVYGGLGAAAALLTWFYLVSRAMVGSAVLNSTLWKRRCRGTSSGFRRTVIDPTPSATAHERSTEQPWHSDQ